MVKSIPSMRIRPTKINETNASIKLLDILRIFVNCLYLATIYHLALTNSQAI